MITLRFAHLLSMINNFFLLQEGQIVILPLQVVLLLTIMYVSF